MAWVHERLGRKQPMPPWVRREHLARYAFAARYVNGKAVVDCACGEGLGTEIFLRAGAESVDAFDQSDAAIAAARASCAGPHVRFQVHSALALPLQDRSIDVYVALETLEHIDEDEQFLAEAARVLKPEGILICSTPNRAVTNPGTSLTDRPWNPFHVREYTRQEFAERLRKVFGRIDWYGQRPTSHRAVRMLVRLARILPRGGAVRIHHVLKLPRAVCDPAGQHEVRPLGPSHSYEYLVAVCHEPRQGSGARAGPSESSSRP